MDWFRFEANTINVDHINYINYILYFNFDNIRINNYMIDIK